MATLFNVANRLPVTVGEKIERSSGGLVSALEGMGEQGYAVQWIGWPGEVIEDPARQREVADMLRRDYGCLPVFLSKDQVESFYEGFSNSSLWPLLHYMPTRFRYEQGWWDQYREVNQHFADTVASTAREGDLVWVHDYQLMLVPAMLRQAMPTLKIGFFLHTPFPSYEVFRCHPRRCELLSGLLGADQIGFHTFGYLRHFQSSLLRLLGIESEMTRIRHDGRSSFAGVYPIGINARRFAAELQSPQFAQHLEAAREANAGKRIILSVERLDYTKGLLHRLDGIDQFLSRLPSAENMRFIFISIPSREKVEEYQTLREELEGRIGRLNGRYASLSNDPIRFIHGSVEFSDLCALYSIADVALVTPLVDGMNLVAKEYIACQREDPGVLVLSEFAGAAEELFNAIIVNPYDAGALADSLQQALDMTREEKRARMEPMRERVMRFDSLWFTRTFVGDLASRVPRDAEPQHIEEAVMRIRRALGSGRKVAFFLDYDGTLREIERTPSDAMPSPAVHAILRKLAGIGNLDVTIISGRVSDDLESWFGDYPFGLIAEHGATIRRPGQREWEQLDKNIRYEWKDEALKILRLFEGATPGSFIEIKRTSLVWHYRKADPEFGSWKANELADELSAVAANLPIQVRHGNKIVEVVAAEISKGAAVSRILDQGHWEAVLVAGDDQTDESMYALSVPNLVSTKVGEGDTQAQFHVRDPAAFRQFLREATRDA